MKKPMKIININERFGDPIELDSVQEMAAAIKDCGYNLPSDGLVENRDYEVLEEEDSKGAKK